MKKPVSKRRQPLVRVAVYSFMTLSVVVLVSILMLVVLGYSFNQKDGRLEQGGLLQFGSVPTGATVTLDELTLGTRTNTKATVDSGNHSVSFNRNGYRTWQKSINILPGQIGWLNYARMVPTELKPESQRTFTSLAGSLASPGRKWIALQQSADQPVFEIADIQSDSVKYTPLTIPETVYTVPAAGMTQTFGLETWSRDEEALLIKHTYDEGKVEWLLVDRDEPAKAVNINASLGVNPSRIVFAGNGNRLLFAQTEDSVRRINIDDMTLSRPLVTRVDNFNVFDDKTITYATVGDEAGKRTVGYAAVDIEQPVPIQTYAADGQSLQAVLKVYFNKRYLSVAHGQMLTIKNGDLPTRTNKGDLKSYAQATLPAGVTTLSSSSNGRFVMAQLPDGYATYDLELKKYDKTTWANLTTVQRPLQWLDDYILWSDNGGQLRMYDFDGANQQNIMSVVEGQTAGISPNGKFFYGVTKSDKGFELSRVQMTP